MLCSYDEVWDVEKSLHAACHVRRAWVGARRHDLVLALSLVKGPDVATIRCSQRVLTLLYVRHILQELAVEDMRHELDDEGRREFFEEQEEGDNGSRGGNGRCGYKVFCDNSSLCLTLTVDVSSALFTWQSSAMRYIIFLVVAAPHLTQVSCLL